MRAAPSAFEGAALWAMKFVASVAKTALRLWCEYGCCTSVAFA